MKVLVVLREPPLPEGGAPGRCAIGLLQGLRAHGLEVHAIAARHHRVAAGRPPAHLRVELVDVTTRIPSVSDYGPAGSYSRAELQSNGGLELQPRWRSYLTRLRYPRGELSGGEFGARVRELAADADVVHLEETGTAWCSLGVAAPALVRIHYLIQLDRFWNVPWRSAFPLALEYARSERAAIRRHEYLAASSARIADAVRQRSSRSKVVLAPLSLAQEYYSAALLDGPPTAGIIGHATWPTTAAAVRRLVERVWPRVHREVPEARLLVAGRRMQAFERLAEVPGVDVLGEVPSASEFLRGLSLLLYPLERGSGMKVKVLESLACGLPVVTTPAGAEGVDADGGVVIESDDERLAAAAVELLRDASARRERGAAGRAAFERHYAPRPATEPLLALYRRMAAR